MPSFQSAFSKINFVAPSFSTTVSGREADEAHVPPDLPMACRPIANELFLNNNLPKTQTLNMQKTLLQLADVCICCLAGKQEVLQHLEKLEQDSRFKWQTGSHSSSAGIDPVFDC